MVAENDGIEKRFGIIHTGLIIENYSDEVEAPLEGNGATARFLKFGNMLLTTEGSLGSTVITTCRCA